MYKYKCLKCGTLTNADHCDSSCHGRLRKVLPVEKEFHIVEGNDADTVQVAVNYYLARGWDLHGDLIVSMKTHEANKWHATVHTAHYCQGLVRTIGADR